MAEGGYTSGTPLDMSRLVSVARHFLTENRDEQPIFQQLIAICTAVENVHDGVLAHFDRIFKNTCVTDAEFDTITKIIPVDVGCPDSCSAMDSAIEHENRIFFALFLLQAIASDTLNTAVLLASDHGVHPLLKLQSSVQHAQQTGKMVSQSTLKNILLVLAQLHSPLSLFCTEAMRKQVLYQSGKPGYNMEHHAVVAWDAIRRHVFMDATDEASKCQRLEVVLNLDHASLLAKVVTTLRDVLRPLQQRNDTCRSAKQCPSTSVFDVTEKVDGIVPVNPMHIQGHGFQVPQHSRHPCQKELQPPALQDFNNLDEMRVPVSRFSSPKRRTPTPTSQSERAGVTHRRFTGTVTCNARSKDFAFITCSELRELFHKDVWVHQEQLHAFWAGQLVTFEVVINEQHQLQAVNLRRWMPAGLKEALCFSV